MKIKVFNSETQGKVNEINLTLATATDGKYIVGRSPQSGLILDSSDVSRKHGKFFLQNEDYYYSDLGSANGSLINNKLAKKNQSYLLKTGDVIRIGDFFLIMEAISKETETSPATVFNSDWQSFAKIDTPEEATTQTPEPVSEVPELVTSKSEQLSPATEELSQGSKVVHALEEAESEVMAPTSKAVSEVYEPEKTYIQAPEEFEEVVEATTIQVPEELAEVPEEEAESAQITTDTTPEPATPTPEAEAVPEDITQTPEEEEEELAEAVPEDITQTPEQEEEEELAEVVPEATTIQVPEELAEVPEEEAESAQITTDTTPEPATPTPEAEAVPEDITQTPEEEEEELAEAVPEDITQTPEQEEEEELAEVVPEDITQTPEQEEEEELAEVVVEATTIQVPKELAEVPEEEAESAQIITKTTPEPVTPAPEAVAVPEDVIQNSQEEEVESEVMSQPPETASKAFEIISKKYIALMAHDTKKSEIVQFVNQYKAFLSKCLTIATPSISETLYQKTGLAVSQKTPLVPVGGYQAIASLVGTGEILAVVLLRDVMVTQLSQANEEALLRLCNINQILVATNVSTAEAVMHYIKDMVTSL